MPVELYADRMKKHLAESKRQRLGIDEDGVWRGNTKAYAHVLPEALQRLNILEPVRREFWQYHAEHQHSLVLHTDFHHLNSSQAFAFNLFFPFLGLSTSVQPLLEALRQEHREVRCWSFEAMPDQEERTTFDFAAEFVGRGRLLVKLS